MIREIKSRWVGYLAHMGEVKNWPNLWTENLKGGDNLEDVGVSGRVKLKQALNKWHMRV